MPKRATAAERRHMGRVAEEPCLVCGMPATVHHVTSDGHKRIARDNMQVVPLCPRHHQIQHGPRESVEALGHGGFTRTHGIDLLAEAKRRADPSYWEANADRIADPDFARISRNYAERLRNGK